MTTTNLDCLRQARDALLNSSIDGVGLAADAVADAIDEIEYLRKLRRSLLQIIEDDTQKLCDILQRERENAVGKAPQSASITSSGLYSTRGKA